MVRSRLALYGITVVITLVVFIIICMPASIVLKLYQNDLPLLPDTNIFQISGSIWNGSANIQYLTLPASEINWSLVPEALLEGRIVFTLSATGTHHELVGHFFTDADQAQFLGLRGFINSRYINEVGKHHGLLLSGAFNFREINLSIDNDWFSSASGNIDWTGGNVMFQNGKRGQTVSLPGLSGIFSVKEKKLTLDVYNEGQLGLSIHLQRDGWVFLQFKRRFLSLAGFPSGENIDPDSVIFTIEEKIL